MSILPCMIPSKDKNTEAVVWSVCTDGTINEICESKDRRRIEMGTPFSVIKMLKGENEKPRAFFGG